MQWEDMETVEVTFDGDIWCDVVTKVRKTEKTGGRVLDVGKFSETFWGSANVDALAVIESGYDKSMVDVFAPENNKEVGLHPWFYFIQTVWEVGVSCVSSEFGELGKVVYRRHTVAAKAVTMLLDDIT